VRLHIDSQPYKVLTRSPLMVEYPGIATFVFPSVKIEEVMADKIVAIAFRNNLGGRDIFDIYYHWIKAGIESLPEDEITALVREKLKQRKLSRADFNRKISERFKDTPPQRVYDEWERYLPAAIKNKAFYKDMYENVRTGLAEFKL